MSESSISSNTISEIIKFINSGIGKQFLLLMRIFRLLLACVASYYVFRLCYKDISITLSGKYFFHNLFSIYVVVGLLLFILFYFVIYGFMLYLLEAIYKIRMNSLKDELKFLDKKTVKDVRDKIANSSGLIDLFKKGLKQNEDNKNLIYSMYAQAIHDENEMVGSISFLIIVIVQLYFFIPIPQGGGIIHFIFISIISGLLVVLYLGLPIQFISLYRYINELEKKQIDDNSGNI